MSSRDSAFVLASSDSGTGGSGELLLSTLNPMLPELLAAGEPNNNVGGT